ncbi:MAG: alpha/beta hydrolase [Bacteroidetes bacterium]|nr:alpha/beta hydrolase [Bacteroidota bacterium]
MPYTAFKKKELHYTDHGKGDPIVLLHGFTEDLRIWKHFSARLSKNYRVVCIDLPGHGKSECIAEAHPMELMVDSVFAVLKYLKLKKCLLIGHSMGGYITLAFASKYPGLLKGFVLFHSHCFADSPEDKRNRTRTVEVVKKDRFGFLSMFIPGLFPEEVRKKFQKEIEFLICCAREIPREGIVAALKGMRERKDQTALLKSTKLPVMFILGLKDSKAPALKLWDMISLPAVSESLILRDCGHMGYIEAPEITLKAIKNFARRVF